MQPKLSLYIILYDHKTEAAKEMRTVSTAQCIAYGIAVNHENYSIFSFIHIEFSTTNRQILVAHTAAMCRFANDLNR